MASALFGRSNRDVGSGGVMTSVAAHYQYQGVDPLNEGGRCMDVEGKRSVIECFVHAFNSFDVDTMVSLLDPDAEYRCIVNGAVLHGTSGIDEFRSLGEQWRLHYSSRKLTVMEMYEKGCQVIMEINYAAVMAADSADGMKAGDTVKREGISEVVFRDDKILSITEIF